MKSSAKVSLSVLWLKVSRAQFGCVAAALGCKMRDTRQVEQRGERARGGS